MKHILKPTEVICSVREWRAIQRALTAAQAVVDEQDCGNNKCVSEDCEAVRLLKRALAAIEKK